MLIINDSVLYNEDDGCLDNNHLGMSVTMAPSSNRLFLILISNHGSPVERDEILKSVWDEYGLRSSNSNLNQYISMLRKQLVQVGLPEDTIITIPKVGFMLNGNLSVKKIENASINNKKNLSNKKNYNFIYFFVALFFSLLCFFATLIYFKNYHIPSIKTTTINGYNKNCIVKSISDISLLKHYDLLNIGDCDSNTEYFTFLDKDGLSSRLIATCKKTRGEKFVYCVNNLGD